MTQKIIIQGIPYDEKSSFLKGAAKAPPLIRETFHSFASNYFAENGINTDSPRVLDKGDTGIEDYFAIEEVTKKHLDESPYAISLGGDHSITYPIVKAFSGHYPELDMLHIDAHPDLYDELLEDKYSHASPLARIMEGGYASRLVQVGIRTITDHQRAQAERFGVEICEMRHFENWELPKFANPVYLSIDMDAFDPAFAPGVSHQEPGGLTSRQVIDIIAAIDQKIVGADIVEYNPDRDSQNITCALAAKLLRELLGKLIAQHDS